MKPQIRSMPVLPRGGFFAKLPACVLLLLAMASPARADDPAPSIKAMLDLHDSYDLSSGKPVPPTLRARGGHFHVLLENTSNQPIWLVSIEGEFYPNLTIEIAGEDGKTASFTPFFDEDAPRGPAFRLLRPKEIAVVDVQYVGGGGIGEGAYAFPFPAAGETRKVSIRAVFDKTSIHPFAGLSKLNLGVEWAGKAVSDPVNVILQGGR